MSDVYDTQEEILASLLRIEAMMEEDRREYDRSNWPPPPPPPPWQPREEHRRYPEWFDAVVRKMRFKPPESLTRRTTSPSPAPAPPARSHAPDA